MGPELGLCPHEGCVRVAKGPQTLIEKAHQRAALFPGCHAGVHTQALLLTDERVTWFRRLRFGTRTAFERTRKASIGNR
jgi:hypothetical protein